MVAKRKKIYDFVINFREAKIIINYVLSKFAHCSFFFYPIGFLIPYRFFNTIITRKLVPRNVIYYKNRLQSSIATDF